MKIVVNRCYGGFGLSATAIDMLCKLKGLSEDDFSIYDLPRNDPHLVTVVESLSCNANGSYSDLRVIEIPDGIEWYIHDYDGAETIHENHRSW